MKNVFVAVALLASFSAGAAELVPLNGAYVCETGLKDEPTENFILSVDKDSGLITSENHGNIRHMKKVKEGIYRDIEYPHHPDTYFYFDGKAKFKVVVGSGAMLVDDCLHTTK